MNVAFFHTSTMADTEWPSSGPPHMGGPPTPPKLRPAVSLTLRQWIGIPILLVIPILAMFGVFGAHTRTEQVRAGRLAVAIMYPDRVRYRQTLGAQLAVQNTGTDPIDTIIVQYDTTYLNAFLISGAVPGLGSSYAAPIISVQPGETRVTTLVLAGDRRGRARGSVRVSAGADTVRIPLSTFVFP